MMWKSNKFQILTNSLHIGSPLESTFVPPRNTGSTSSSMYFRRVSPTDSENKRNESNRFTAVQLQ